MHCMCSLLCRRNAMLEMLSPTFVQCDCSARLLLLMGSCMLFYLLTTQSWYLRDNAFGAYFKTFWLYYLATLVTAFIDGACGLSAIFLSGKGQDMLLEHKGYQILNGACQVAYGLHFACVTWTAALVLQRQHWQLQTL